MGMKGTNVLLLLVRMPLHWCAYMGDVWIGV